MIRDINLFVPLLCLHHYFECAQVCFCSVVLCIAIGFRQLHDTTFIVISFRPYSTLCWVMCWQRTPFANIVFDICCNCALYVHLYILPCSAAYADTSFTTHCQLSMWAFNV